MKNYIVNNFKAINYQFTVGQLSTYIDLEGCSLKTMMFEKYPSISPYTYCANNPMKYVDPSGMSPDDPPGDGNNNPYKNQPIGYESGKGTEKNPIVLPDVIITPKNSESKGEGRDGFRFTNDNNSRQNNETITNRDVGSINVTDIISILDSWVGTAADFLSDVFSRLKKTDPTPMPQKQTPSTEPIPDGDTFEYNLPKFSGSHRDKAYRWAKQGDSATTHQDLIKKGCENITVKKTYKH